MLQLFLLVRYTCREKCGTNRKWMHLHKTQGTVHRDRNMFDEFGFHFNKELPVNSSHFEIYEQLTHQ